MTQKLADLKQAFVPVPRIDDHFGVSGATAKLEVLRTWPTPSVSESASTNGFSASSASTESTSASSAPPPPSFTRLTLIDVNRAEANQPIDFIARGVWRSTLASVEKYDVLIISGCRVERVEVEGGGSGTGAAHGAAASSSTSDPMEVDYRMVVDDSTEAASIIVYNWRDRILARPGKLHTARSIRGGHQ